MSHRATGSEQRQLRRVSLTAIFLLLLFASITPASAHESWLLTPLQMLEIFDRPLDEVWHRITLLSIGTGLVLIIGLAVAEYLDRHFQPLEQALDRRYHATLRDWGLLILRVTLGLLLIAAALGLNPRAGTPYLTEPTLFVPDLELSAVTSLSTVIAGLELIVGVALLLGIYVNFASLIVILLTLFGLFVFGPQLMLGYAGHIAAPAFLLLIEDRDRFEHITPRDAPLEKFVQRLLPFMNLERGLILLRVLTGLTFMYLAVNSKFLHSPQLEQIIADHSMPTFGIPPESLVFIMSAIEIAGGFALVVGIAERLVAATLIGAMLFFALVLGESPLLHANIFGILLVIILLGPGYWKSDEAIREARDRRGFGYLRIGAAAVLCVAISLSSLWASQLREFLPNAEARLVRAEGPFQPAIETVAIEPLGSGFYRLDIDTKNFTFTTNPLPFVQDSFQGHAHVYAGPEQLITLYASEGIVGPVPEGTTSLTVSLMNPYHCFVETEEGVLIREVPLPAEA
ncbi:MAG: DoxX family protein [Pseudomonadota bacterium]